MSNSDKLFQPLKVGRYDAEHRIVLCPLTRNRNDLDGAPNDLHVKYYSSRATKGGLLISEATHMCPQSIQSHTQPGIWTQHQAEQWRKVTDAVHEKGGIFSMQFWHVGRVAHHSFKDHPLAKEVGAITGESSSATLYQGESLDYNTLEKVKYQPPVEMTLERIEEFKQQYLHAADLAFNVAGVDIIEIHGAHGYLFDQFHNDGVNKRTDQYGGSIENRIRLTLEVVRLLCEKFGHDRIAIRLSPHSNTDEYFGVTDSNPEALYTALFTALSEFNLAYLLVTEPKWDRRYQGDCAEDGSYLLPLKSIKYRKHYTGPVIIGGGGFTPLTAVSTVVDTHRVSDSEEDQHHRDNTYTMIGFGRWYISNPDLVLRIRHGLPLNRYYRPTFYTVLPFDKESYAVGYTDYPTFEELITTHLNTEDKQYTLDEVIGNKELIAKIVEATKGSPYALVYSEEIGYSATSSEYTKK